MDWPWFIHLRHWRLAVLVMLGLVAALLLGRGLALLGQPLDRESVGLRLLAAGAAEDAAAVFEQPLWQGVALDRAGRFQRAAGQFALEDSITGLYNLANAYAQLGLYDAGITALETLLRRQPDHADARHNLAVLQAAAAREQTLEAASRETAEAGRWEDGLLEERTEGAASEALEQTVTEEMPPASSSSGDAADSTTAAVDRDAPGDSADGPGGSEQAGERAEPAGFSLQAAAGEEQPFSPDSLPADAPVRPGAAGTGEEEALAAEILLRRIEDDPALVLRARLGMALRRLPAGEP
jgi:Ca-activated chloride channel family protein